MKKLILAAALCFAALPTAAASAFSFVISPDLLIAPPGGFPNSECANFTTLSCVIFSGSLTPDTTQDLILMDIKITFSDDPLNNLTGNSGFFFCNTAPGDCPPSFLAQTDPVYSGQIFEVDIDPLTLPGTYHGMAQILGGPNGEMDPLGDPQAFTLIVTPEPSAAWLLFAALGLALFAQRRRARLALALNRAATVKHRSAKP